MTASTGTADVTPTQIRIPPEVKRAAKVRAASEGTNLSHVVVRLLREYGEGKAAPLPNGTRVRVNWEKSSFHGHEGVIAGQVADRYRVEIDHNGTFLRPHELEVIDAPDA